MEKSVTYLPSQMKTPRGINAKGLLKESLVVYDVYFRLFISQSGWDEI